MGLQKRCRAVPRGERSARERATGQIQANREIIADYRSITQSSPLKLSVRSSISLASPKTGPFDVVRKASRSIGFLGKFAKHRLIV